MGLIDTAIREHEERCNMLIEKRLVPWNWLIGIIIIILMSIGGISWSLSAGYEQVSNIAKQNFRRAEKFEKRLDKLEAIQNDIKWIRSDLENKNKQISK